MHAVRITRWLLLLAGLGGAAAWLASGPVEARIDLYAPTAILIVGIALFNATLALEGLRGPGQRLRGSDLLVVVMAGTVVAALLALFALPGAWGVESWTGYEVSRTSAILMTVPAAAISAVASSGAWQQCRIDRARMQLAADPSPEIAQALTDRAMHWTMAPRLAAGKTLLDAGYPGHADRLLTPREDNVDALRATERVYHLVIARAARGDRVGASRALTELPSPVPPRGQRMAQLSKARVALVTGEPDAALELLDATAAPPRRRDRAALATTDRALRAQAHADRGEPQLARRELAALRDSAGDAVLEVMARGDGPVARLAAELLHGGTGTPFR